MAPSFPVERISFMGKTRKVSKGYTYGFVPDYRHAVESEGFGRTQEDSSPPRRKSIDSHQQFGVPIQVLNLSKLSRIERKELGLRLKQELEQVRTLQRSIPSMVVPISPSSDVHSCSAGQRRPPPEYSRSMSLPASHSKKKAPPPGRKKPGVGQTSGNAILMKQCETLLNRLMGHNFGWVFNTPVDVVALKIPDYYTVIQHPMDLGTVKTKLMSGKYPDPWGFAADVRLTFSNAMTYNPRGNDVHIMAETMSKFFEVRWKAIEKKLSVVPPMRQNVIEETETETVNVNVNVTPPYKKKKPSSSLGNEKKQEPVERKMSDAEKHKLSSELEASLADIPESIIDFLKENSSNGNQTEDEIEIEIETLSNDVLFKLRKLLDDYFAEKQKNIVKVENENESGFSNSSMPACKGNDVNDEDVDIGGDEPPISSFPPVEIEKDTGVRNSSSSSSSGSGSSSSDSDSESCSGSESDPAKASKDTTDPKEQITHESKGEGERQVSPDKLYRAALLRNRFADTILKAQERTNLKEDRERLRLEKEELEKRRKQEKARLEAEAKAAEEARKNAELEAKRKREAEREAARQAIQKMEKMVDINDGCGFLEDLEMLSVAPAEPLQGLIDETVAEERCFNFNGKRNPLEQLGLYMKDDNEDDDEEDPPHRGDDPEEGEID